MCLRFMFLLTTRLAAWLRLARREETWKTAEILILRHQLAVLQQQQPRRPKLNAADRALLATLLAVIPKARRHRLRLLVTPDTILRWHHDIARRRWAARSKRGKTGRPATRRNIKALVIRLARENRDWSYRRRLLVLAACDATADLATLQRASTLLSLDLTDLTAAEEAGLVRVEDGRIEFTHPLLRSAAYHTAEPADLRAAHRALADGTDPGRDPIRRAWHLAAATVGPDQSVAASLDLAARAAGARNAFITASHQRAAELTQDPGRQVSRWIAAGHAAHLGETSRPPPASSAGRPTWPPIRAPRPTRS
jgi:hypothetical protein